MSLSIAYTRLCYTHTLSYGRSVAIFQLDQLSLSTSSPLSPQPLPPARPKPYSDPLIAPLSFPLIDRANDFTHQLILNDALTKLVLGSSGEELKVQTEGKTGCGLIFKKGII